MFLASLLFTLAKPYCRVDSSDNLNSWPIGCERCDYTGNSCSKCNNDLHFIKTNNGCECSHSSSYYEYKDGSCKLVSGRDCTDSVGCSSCFIDYKDTCAVCNNNNDYYMIDHKCYLATVTANCPKGCTKCFNKYNYQCAVCDTDNHFIKNSNNECICDYTEHYTSGDDDKCVCENGYALHPKYNKCWESRNEYCHSGCESCFNSDPKTCITCKSHFQLTNEYTCECEDNFVLDEYEDKCIEAFPSSCPEECNCDENNKCISCKENYLVEYKNDYVTVKTCHQLYSCPSEKSEKCSFCNQDGDCLVCKDDYIYNDLFKNCVKNDGYKNCNIDGCVICHQRNFCDACENGLILNEHGGCILQRVLPPKIIYMKLDNYFSKTQKDVTINLQNVEKEKRRPYYYLVSDDEENIFINNENLIDFQIRFFDKNQLHMKISSPQGADQNPQYTINIKNCYNCQFNIQSSKTSIFGFGKVTLVSDKESIDLDKITLDTSKELYVYSDKKITINEIDIYDTSYNNENDISFFSLDGQNAEKVLAKNVKLQQGSEAKVAKLDIENLFISSGSISGEDITIKNMININYILYINNRFGHIKGNISGIPKEIKVQSTSPNKPLSSNEYYDDYNLVEGYNEEFIQNCEEWAKIYNDNPTDTIYNHAECIKRSDYMQLDLKHIDEPPKSGSNTGMIVGIVVACVVVVGVVVFLLVYFLVIKKRKYNQSSENQDVESNQ